MNTEQKAREWHADAYKYAHPDRAIAEASEIITALLAERQALLDVCKVILKHYSASLDHQPPYVHMACKAVTMCEEQNNE